MLEEGMALEVDGREGMVCFTMEYESKKYVNLFFDDDNKEYKIYEYNIDDKGGSDNIWLKLVDDMELLTELSSEFALEVIDSWQQ